MRQLNGRLYLHYEDMTAACISINTIKGGVKRRSASYQNVPDPDDGRRSMLLFDALPRRVKDMVNKHYDGDVHAWHRHQQEMNMASDDTGRPLQQAIEDAMHKGYLKWMPEIAASGVTRATPEETHEARAQYARVAAVIVVIMGWHKGQFGLSTSGAFLQAAVEELKLQEIKHLRITNVQVLRRKMREAKQNGIVRSVVHANEGRADKCVYEDWHRHHTEAFAALPVRLKAKHVWRAMRELCEDHHKEIPSYEWVKKYLQDPQVRTRVDRTRLSQSEYKGKYMGYMPRRVPLHRSELWMMDGTKINLWYADKDNNIRTANIFTVLDVHSGRILGYVVDHTEDRWTHMRALKMAVTIAGEAPGALMKDRHSGWKSDELKHMKAALEMKGTRFIETIDPQTKGQVERLYLTLQTRYLRAYPSNTADGITSRSKDTLANKDLLADLHRRRLLPTYNMLLHIVDEVVTKYNNDTHEGTRRSPIQRWQDGHPLTATPMQPQDIAWTFWPQRKGRVQNGMVQMQHKQNTYYYDVPQPEIRQKYRQAGSLIIRYDEDRSVIYAFDAITNDFVSAFHSMDPVAMIDPSGKDLRRLASRAKADEVFEKYVQEEAEKQRELAEMQGNIDIEHLVAVHKVGSKDDRDNAETRVASQYYADQQGKREMNTDELEILRACGLLGDNYND